MEQDMQPKKKKKIILPPPGPDFWMEGPQLPPDIVKEIEKKKAEREANKAKEEKQ